MAHEAVQTQQLHGFSQADYDRTRLEIRRLLTNQHSANASPSSSSPVAPPAPSSSSSSPSTSTSKATAPPGSAPGPVPLPAAQQKHQQDQFGRDIRLQIPPTPFHQQQTQSESQSSPARAKGSLDRFLSGDKPQVSSLSSPPRHPAHQQQPQHHDLSFAESAASTPKAGGHMIMDPNDAGGVAPSPSLRQSVKRKADHLDERPHINLNHTLIHEQQQQQAQHQQAVFAARQSQESRLQSSPTDSRPQPHYYPQQEPQPPKLHLPTQVPVPPQPQPELHQRKLEEHHETDESVEDNASSHMAPSTQSSSNGTQPDAIAQNGRASADVATSTPVRTGKPPNVNAGGSRSKGGRRAAQEGAFKRDRNAKPPYSYAALIGQAITATQNNRISLADIYNYIQDNYPFYKKEEAGWQNSIRHNLSLNECFVKTPRTDIDAPGKGSLWCIAPGKEDQFVNGNFVKKGHHKKGRSKKSGAPGEAGSTAGGSGRKGSAKGKDEMDEDLDEEEEDGDEDGDQSHSNEMLADAPGGSSQERPPSQTSTASGSTPTAAPAPPTLMETGPSSDAVAEHQPAAASKPKGSAKGQPKQQQQGAGPAGRSAAARPSKRVKTAKSSVAATRAPPPPAATAAPPTDDLDDLDDVEDEEDDGQETEVERRSAKEEWVLDEDEDQDLSQAAPSAPPQSARGHHRRRSSMLGGSQVPYEEPVKRPNRGLSASTGAAPGYPHAPLLGAPAELLPPLSAQSHGQSRHLRGSSGSSATDLLASPPNRLGASSSFPFMPPASIGQAYRSPEMPSSSSVFGATSSPYIGSSAQNYTQSPVSSMRSSKFQSSSPRQNEEDNLNVDTSPLASLSARPRAGSSPPSTRTHPTQDNPERAPTAIVSRTAEDIKTPPPPTLLSSPRRSLLDGAAAPNNNNNSASRALQLLQSAGSSWPSNGYQGFGLSPVDHKVLGGRSTTPTPAGVEASSGEQRPTASPTPLFSSPGAFNFGGLGNATWSPF